MLSPPPLLRNFPTFHSVPPGELGKTRGFSLFVRVVAAERELPALPILDVSSETGLPTPWYRKVFVPFETI